MQITGTLEGFVPHHTEEPTYQGQPSDYRMKVRVTKNADKLLNELEEHYDKACEWYKNNGGAGRAFFDGPWITNEDGSVTVRITAKPKYEEFPFPVVDGALVPLAEDLQLREGSVVKVELKPKFITPKASKGGLRFAPLGMQVLEAVTTGSKDSGGQAFDIKSAFKKQKGFTQAKPKVEPVSNADVDIDF